jgi:hypothetical protein
MKIDSIQPTLNIESFNFFVKLSKSEQTVMLKEKGIFLDLDSEKNTLTKLYFLNGFFVEEVISRKQNIVIDIIPYKQGYRIENYLEVKRYLN